MVLALELTSFVMIRNQTLVSCKGVAFLSLGVDSSDDWLEIYMTTTASVKKGAASHSMSYSRTSGRRRHNALERTTRTKDADLIICFLLAER